MGAFIEVLVALLLVAAALLVAGAVLTRSLWAPYLRRLKMEADARRVRAIQEDQLAVGREEAEKEIEAHVDPLARPNQEEREEPPTQRVEPRS
jgi:hypothetical protein